MFDQEEFGSDTDDSDFVPEGEGHDASEEEASGDDEKAIHGEDSDKKPSKKKKERKKAGGSSTFSRTPADNSTAEDWKKIDNEVQKELNDKSEAERIDSLWSAFKSDVDKSKTAVTKPKTVEAIKINTNTPSENKSSKTTSSNPASSTKPSSRFGSLFDPTPLPSEEKSSTSTTNTNTATSSSKPKSRFGSLFDDDNSSKTESKPSDNDSVDVKSDEAKVAAGDKIAVTKVYDFAGEIVKVTKEVDANSKEAKKFLESSSTSTEEEHQSGGEGAKRKVGGLASVVGSIGKKAKMGCLDKSKLDWNQFVQETGIKEELTTFNKGKEGYVEKQMFLERADVRQFEIERAAREKTRKSFMK